MSNTWLLLGYRYLETDSSLLLEHADKYTRKGFKRLNEAIVSLLDNYSMVCFRPLNSTSEDSVQELVGHIDLVLNYSDYAEVKDKLNENWDKQEEEIE